MKKIMAKSMFFICSILLGILVFFNSCGNEKEDSNTPPTSTVEEFIAKDADFDGFRNWEVVAILDKALSAEGRAHTDAARTIWIKPPNTKRGTNGQYPIGTILIKEVKGGYGIVAMVKRGGSFNPAHNGWEWFQIDAASKITSRSASNTCNNCHSLVKNQDYAFSKN
ncbi:cytochrome P460 family protein [Haliscomenobacter sp.]|uniref:cytochrome P460 family protein n=1 Tax=Haliscomenobacter sp. TaxID=2717303 RepID=UPI003594476D